MDDTSLTRRSVVRSLSVLPAAATVGCAGLRPNVELEYCNDRLDRPCEGTDIQKDVLRFENTVTSEETYAAGRPVEAAAVVVESPDQLVIHGWAAGIGDPGCRTFELLQADTSGREFRFGVESDVRFFEDENSISSSLGCEQSLAPMYYRADITVDTERLETVQITHVSGGSNSPEEIVLRDRLSL